MRPNSISVHFRIKDNDKNTIIDEGSPVFIKDRGVIKKAFSFREHVVAFFNGGKDDRK